MIRALAVVLGLALGLTAAVAVGGRVGHLRALGLAPAWTDSLDPDAGLPEGRGTVNGAALSWQWRGLRGWAVTLRGPDWQAQAQGWPRIEGVDLTDLRGVVPLAQLDAGAGVLALEGGALTLGWTGALRAGQVQGQARSGPLALRWTGTAWTPVSP